MSKTDLPTTEKLDYFGAALAILYALYYTAIRLFHLYPKTPIRFGGSPSTSVIHKTWTACCSIMYLSHVLYLTLLPRFDYTYNMIFNLTIGLTHNLLWVCYSLPSSLSLVKRYPFQDKPYRPPHVSKAALFVVLTTAATALELFDFPPWGGFLDAHSLWHLSTAPISLYWYRFLIEDALDAGWKLPVKP
ncbi:hypothetical protein ONZ45_g17544 [Pleurotus djamor]|nr:hypothetical protein ONZ45_g17544 [Pleurotus djamor]